MLTVPQVKQVSEMNEYKKVRFVGFAIPTTPSSVVAVGSLAGAGAVAGTYPAFADRDKDIAARLDVMASAVDVAFEQINKQDNDGVLNIFVAPEFYWHSDIGPYVFAPGDTDPADEILAKLADRFPADKYPDTVFVFGTVISAQLENLEAVLNDPNFVQRNNVVKALGDAFVEATGGIQGAIFSMLLNFVQLGHTYPLVEVRNRALIVGSELFEGIGTPLKTSSMTTEKYCASNEDFLLWDVTGKPVITEQSVAYPNIDLSGGDFKVTEGDQKAIFNVADGPTVAVEICLDHSDQRVRKSAPQSPWPSASDGIDLHIVPSCGMQLQPPAVATKSGGLAFNADGLSGLDGVKGGTVVSGDAGGVQSVHVSYIDGDETVYGAHTQLTRVVTGPVGGNSGAPGAKNATFEAPKVDVNIYPVARTTEVDEVFAGGPGAIHIYGLTEALDI